MPLRRGRICNEHFIANFLMSITVKEFWKSVNIWRSYGQEFGVLFFDSRCKEHWIQRITFTAETNAMCTHTHTHRCRWPTYLLHWLSGESTKFVFSALTLLLEWLDVQLACKRSASTTDITWRNSNSFYRTMHVVLLRYSYRKSSDRPSLTLMYRGHIGWTSSNLTIWIISLGSLLLGATTSAI